MTVSLPLLYARNLMRHGRIDPPEFYASHEHRVVYVENAKCACTAIKQALLPKLDHAALGQEEFHRQARRYAFHQSPRGCDTYLHFTFVRDPAERLASCHRDKVSHGESIFSTRTQRLIFAIFAGIDPLATANSPADFGEAVAAIPERLRDRHIASQCVAVRAVRSAKHNFVGRIDNFEADWAALQDRSGLLDAGRLNRSRQDRHQQAESIELRAVANRAYAGDYALLGYPTDERP